MSGTHGYRESQLSKSLRGAGGGPAEATIAVIAEDPTTLEKSERTVRCDLGAVRIRLLEAMQRGDAVVKGRDLAFFDTGRVRASVWQKLCADLGAAEPLMKARPEPKKEDGPALLRKSYLDAVDAGDITIEQCAAELDRLVEKLTTKEGK